MLRVILWMLLFSLFAVTHVTAQSQAKYQAWYRQAIDHEERLCKEAETSLKESEKLLREARTLIARATAGDMEGRYTARQAEWKAQSAISKNTLQKTRTCSRARYLAEKFIDAEAARNAIAMPLFTGGDVKVQTKDGWASWDGKTPLLSGQVIKTGTDGYAEIVLPGSPAEIHMGPNSEFAAEQDDLTLRSGRFYYLKSAIQEELKDYYGRRVILKKDVVMTVRGTRFVAIVKPGGISSVALIEGEVAFRLSRNDKEIIIRGGEQLQFRDGKILRGPEPLNPEILKETGGKP